MSGCMIFFGGVSQLAHNAALGVAAMYGNGGAALTETPGTIFSPNLIPANQLSGLYTDAFPVMPFRGADPQRTTQADTAFAAVQQTGANPPLALGQSPRNRVADIAAMEPETREPGADITGDGEDDEIAQDNTSQMQTAMLSRGGLTLSGGYSSIEGPIVEASIARRNIGGRNREITASARYSKIQTLFELGYADGNFMGSSMTFAPSLFANWLSATGFGSNIGSTPFSQSARGINFHFDRKFGRGISATANYRLSDDSFRMRGKGVVCDNGIFGSPICSAIGNTTSSILSLSLTLDRREIKAGATRGFKLRLTQDLAGLGGTTRYTRTRFSSDAHIGMGGDLNLSLRADAGFMAPIGNRTIPLFDRFYIGDTSMRGFDLRGIGPKIIPSAAQPGQSVAIGGRIYYAARAELSLPFGGKIGNYGLQSSTFVDVGSVFGARKVGLLPGETLIGNSAKPRVAIGFGLSFNTPAGKLRLDFARPVVKQIGDRTKTLSISFGAAF